MIVLQVYELTVMVLPIVVVFALSILVVQCHLNAFSEGNVLHHTKFLWALGGKVPLNNNKVDEWNFWSPSVFSLKENEGYALENVCNVWTDYMQSKQTH